MPQFQSVNLEDILPLMIPILAIVMGIGAGMIAIVADFRKKRILFELHHKERMLAIERGMEVPPLPEEFFGAAPRGRCANGRSRYRGIIFILVGLTLYLAPGGMMPHIATEWGLVIAAWGLGKLVVDLLNRRDERLQEERAAAAAPKP